jgi:hypothetical protein
MVLAVVRKPGRRFVAGVVTVGALALAASAAAGSATRPAVRLSRESPVTVRGTGFGSRERIHLTVRVAGRASWGKTVRAGGGGGFTARFAGRRIPPCRDYVISAVGAKGHTARVHRSRSEDCAQPPAP